MHVVGRALAPSSTGVGKSLSEGSCKSQFLSVTQRRGPFSAKAGDGATWRPRPVRTGFATPNTVTRKSFIGRDTIRSKRLNHNACPPATQPPAASPASRPYTAVPLSAGRTHASPGDARWQQPGLALAVLPPRSLAGQQKGPTNLAAPPARCPGAESARAHPAFLGNEGMVPGPVLLQANILDGQAPQRPIRGGRKGGRGRKPNDT